MRTLAATGVLLVAAGGIAYVLWAQGTAPPALPGDGDAAKRVAAGTEGPRAGGPLGPSGDIAGGVVTPDPRVTPDPAGGRLDGATASQFAKWALDTREDHTFHHCVSGNDVPEDIRAATGMTAAEATAVGNVLREEDARLAAALRAYAATLQDFQPTPEQVAAAGGHELLQMVTGHQGLFLEMAPFFQNMDEDTQRRFYEERRPWTDFFKDDTMVIRLCKVVHAVRAESYRQMREQGVDADTLDRLQARYLLPGHFRYPGNVRFEFGPKLQ